MESGSRGIDYLLEIKHFPVCQFYSPAACQAWHSWCAGQPAWLFLFSYETVVMFREGDVREEGQGGGETSQ